MDNGAVRQTPLRVLERVAETQEDLMGLLVELGHQDGQRESDVALWEHLLDLAATVKVQVGLLRTLTTPRARERAARGARGATRRTMTLVELRDRVIAEGLASVRATEVGARQRGAIRGFERCYDLYTPQQFTQAIADDERELMVLRDLYNRGLVELDAYWERRFEQAQIEHVWKVLRVALGIPPFYASAALQYARIVGVREEEA